MMKAVDGEEIGALLGNVLEERLNQDKKFQAVVQAASKQVFAQFFAGWVKNKKRSSGARHIEINPKCLNSILKQKRYAFPQLDVKEGDHKDSAEIIQKNHTYRCYQFTAKKIAQVLERLFDHKKNHFNKLSAYEVTLLGGKVEGEADRCFIATIYTLFFCWVCPFICSSCEENTLDSWYQEREFCCIILQAELSGEVDAQFWTAHPEPRFVTKMPS